VADLGKPVPPQVRIAHQRLLRQQFRRCAHQALREQRCGDDDVRRVEERLADQARPAAAPDAQPDVEALALQVHHLLRRMQVQRDAGLQRLPARQARQQPALRERRQGRHPQRLRGAAMRLRGGEQPRLQRGKHLCHPALERLARRVQRQPSALAREQLETQLRLQPADLLADGAVRQVQAFGRGAQVLRLRSGTECSEVVERETVE
jgi:hypothetical protein